MRIQISDYRFDRSAALRGLSSKLINKPSTINRDATVDLHNSVL